MDGLAPYPVMKDSGLTWLGQIPDPWKILRAKSVFTVVDVRSETGTEELLTVSSNDGVLPRSQKTVTMFKAESYVGHKLCWPGDLVINSLWAWMQGLGFSRHYGLVSSAYSVYRPKPAFTNYADYFHYALRSAAYKWELQTRSKGVWLSRLQLSDPAFLDMPIIVPPPDEQSAIVRFLNYVDRRIRSYIRNRQRLIKLLEEQKQGILQRMLGHGLAPNPKLKLSGLECCPLIPEEYTRTTLGRVCLSIRDGTHNPPPAVAGIHRLLSVRNIIGGRFVTRADDRTMSPDAYDELQRSYTVQAGDVVLALVGATTGKSAVVEEMENVTVQRSIGIIRPNHRLIDSRFLNLVVRSDIVQSQIRQIMDKYAAQPGIYLEDVAALQVVFPSLDEQSSILDAVESQWHPVDTFISRVSAGIKLLREFHVRLIADVVTGKADVRCISRELAEEVQDIELEEEQTDLDQQTDDAEVDGTTEEAEA